MKTQIIKFTSAFAVLLFFAVSVTAQSGGIFSITQSVVAGGGGQNITGGIFTADYTIGQAVAGNTSSGSPYDLTHGFWADSAASATPTPTPSVAITGTVTYGNAVSGPPPPRFVSNVLISGAGSPAVSILTDFPGGAYSLGGFGASAYTVTPSKTGGVNGITSFDAAKIAQHVAGNNLLTGNQLIVADVSNNGSISSFDAGQIARYVTSSPPFGITGTWKFSPLNRTYPSITTNITGEDYTALLMGEVSGNWTNTGARPVNSRQGQLAGGSTGDVPEVSAVVKAPRLVSRADTEVLIPVAVEGAANKGVIAYEFALRYDPSVIQPQANPVDLAGTSSSRLSFTANADEPGLLRVAVYGPMPLNGDGVLLNLRFTAVGSPGSVSPLAWERIMLNEGNPVTLAADGQVELSSAASNQAAISGRLLTAFGSGVANARVTLTDSAGQSRSIISNGFGVYRFGRVQVGQTYTITVDSQRFKFTPLTVSVTGQLVSVDMIAMQ